MVIVCTDGMANEGLGSFGYSGSNSEEANQFYEKVGQYA